MAGNRKLKGRKEVVEEENGERRTKEAEGEALERREVSLVYETARRRELR